MFSQMCRGLREIHRRGFVHRAIKLSSFNVSADGGIKISDLYNVAKVGSKPVKLGPLE